MNTSYRDHFFRNWIEDRFPNADQREFCLADIEEAFNLAFRLGYTLREGEELDQAREADTVNKATDWKEIEPNVFELIEPGKQPQYCVRVPDYDLGNYGKQIGYRFVSVGCRKSLDRYLDHFGHP